MNNDTRVLRYKAAGGRDHSGDWLRAEAERIEREFAPVRIAKFDA